MQKALALLLLAGAAFALDPAVTLKEQPRLLMHADGTQEYYIGYGLRVRNPSQTDEILSYSLSYSLPYGHRIAETNANFNERKELEPSGTIKGGRIPPMSEATYNYKVVPAQMPLRIVQKASENELEIRIANEGNLPLGLKRLTPKGWMAASSNMGMVEKGEVLFDGESIGPGDERTLKIASPSHPVGYALSLENEESLADRFSPTTVTTASLLSVEKQAAQNGTYLITLSYRNPTGFTQEIRELKLLKTSADGAETLRDFGGTEAGPGRTIEFTATDDTEGSFYWYSVRADTEHAFYAEKGPLVIETAPETRGPPTGFALLDLQNGGAGEWLKSLAARISTLINAWK